MIGEFLDIAGSTEWRDIRFLDAGWSADKKYIINTNIGEKLLLRISPYSMYDRRKAEFQTMKKLDKLDIVMPKSLAFGGCDKGVYTLLSWIEGEDAIFKVPTFSDDAQYDLGHSAGKILKKIHSIKAPIYAISWPKRYNKKIDNYIKRYEECGLSYNNDDLLLKYIADNRYLLDDRPITFQHGDYHLGNMVIMPNGDLGIIDFDRLDYGDPYEEFNRIVWCADKSVHFASGYINGYFENRVPDDFFSLMALYICANSVGALSWAISFGAKEIDVMVKQVEDVLSWYDNFQRIIPGWYIKP